MHQKGLLKGHANILNQVLRLSDWSLILISGILSYYVSNAYETFTAIGVQGLPEHYLHVILLAIVLSAAIFPLSAVYKVWRGSSTLTEIKQITIAWVLVALTLTLLAFFTKSGEAYSRSWMGIWLASGWMALVASRVVLRYVLRYLRSSGYNHRHIVIVGTGDQAAIVADRLQKSTWFGLEISALFSSGELSDHMPPWLRDKKMITQYEDQIKTFFDNAGMDYLETPMGKLKQIKDSENRITYALEMD